MPSIKFTALVSDMKGKANGSVFSKNKQGNYFRNNPKGGGRKTARWDQQKVRFGSLANSYRSLTTEEKEAWDNLAASWPLENKFGETYYPSGYQLYMQLNGNLTAIGYPALTTPGVKRTLPNPDDAIVTQAGEFTFTPMSAASFNFPPNPATPLNTPFCPQCYENVDGVCVPVTTGPTFDNCVIDTQKVFNVNLQNECSSDQDCYDAGLGTGTDIECVDGTCVYVGDGIENVFQGGYVANIATALRDNGEWKYNEGSGNCVFTMSFQLTSFEEIIRVLQTSNNPIILISNYHSKNGGFFVRVRSNTAADCIFEVGFMFKDMLGGGEQGTSVNSIVVPIDYLRNSPVVSINMDFIDHLNFRFAIGNSGWLNYTTNGWMSYQNWALPYWDVPDHVGTYADNAWQLDQSIWGIVFGAGIFSHQYNYAVADIRLWDSLLTIEDVEKVTRGMVLTTERILYPMNGLPKPKCSFDLCGEGQACKGTKECKCNHGVCGYWTNGMYANHGQNQPIDVAIRFAVPIYQFNDPANNDYSLAFTNNWINKENGPFVDNQAIYAPSLTVSLPQPEESGFVAVFYASYPNANSQRAGSSVYIGNRSMNQITTTELHDMIKANLSNVPANSYINIFVEIMDSLTGEKPKKKKHRGNVIRFKAGSELASTTP